MNDKRNEKKQIANMPGPGGSLGMCAVCGGPFIKEILIGESVEIMGSFGFSKDFPVHKKCKELLIKVGETKRWQDLPDGPIRKCYEERTNIPSEN